MLEVSEWGLWALGLISFLAATLIPMSSEAAVVTALTLGFTPTEVLITASIGNCLACLLNYAIGWAFAPWTQSKLSRSAHGQWVLVKASKYKWGILLLSWTPILGDPITLAAGLLRMNIFSFLILVLPLRILRYGAIIWLMP